MKLRFAVDQAECFRNGIDCPKSIVTVEVEPKELTQEQRHLIANRMFGIDVVVVVVTPKPNSPNAIHGYPSHERITAKAPTLEALLKAVYEDEASILKRANEGDTDEYVKGGVS